MLHKQKHQRELQVFQLAEARGTLAYPKAPLDPEGIVGRFTAAARVAPPAAPPGAAPAMEVEVVPAVGVAELVAVGAAGSLRFLSSKVSQRCTASSDWMAAAKV